MRPLKLQQQDAKMLTQGAPLKAWIASSPRGFLSVMEPVLLLPSLWLSKVKRVNAVTSVTCFRKGFCSKARTPFHSSARRSHCKDLNKHLQLTIWWLLSTPPQKNTCAGQNAPWVSQTLTRLEVATLYLQLIINTRLSTDLNSVNSALSRPPKRSCPKS